MSDILQKAICKNKEVVVYALDATELLQESMDRVNTWPPATKHLGQAMMAALLMQALDDGKGSEVVSLQWMCDGPFGHLYAEARNYGEVRGTISNPRPENVADYSVTLGDGVLQVRRMRAGSGLTSVVNSVGVVSTDMVEFLEKSEQKNCGMNFSVVIDLEEGKNQEPRFRVKSALAYMVHILPKDSESKMNEALLRWDSQMRALGNISTWKLNPKNRTLDMMRLLLGEDKPEISLNQRVKFHCNCSVERASRALTLLETQEKKEGIFKQEEETEIRCEYCGKVYTLSSDGSLVETSMESVNDLVKESPQDSKTKNVLKKKHSRAGKSSKPIAKKINKKSVAKAKSTAKVKSKTKTKAKVKPKLKPKKKSR